MQGLSRFARLHPEIFLRPVLQTRNNFTLQLLSDMTLCGWGARSWEILLPARFHPFANNHGWWNECERFLNNLFADLVYDWGYCISLSIRLGWGEIYDVLSQLLWFLSFFFFLRRAVHRNWLFSTTLLFRNESCDGFSYLYGSSRSTNRRLSLENVTFSKIKHIIKDA